MSNFNNINQNAQNAAKGMLNLAGGMAETTEKLEGLNRGLGIFEGQTKKVLKNLSTAMFSPGTVLNDAAKLQDLTYEMVRTSMGQTEVAGEMLTKQLSSLWYESAQFGITLEDNITLMQDMGELMQVNTFLSNEQALNMGILAKTAGVATKEIATIVEGFDTVGVGTDKAIANISQMQKDARSYGINVGQFMKLIGSNVKLLASYNFKDGVQGLSRMVAKAQALRIDMGNTVKFADKLMDPEFAIETAANFQMLGGAIGDLGDPFKLLHMAQNDMEGLQDSILGMAESAVVFDESTGKFDISVSEMYRLRAAADAAGMSYEELSQAAIKSAQKTRKLDILGSLGMYDEDTKEMISNLGDIDASGNITVTLPDEDDPLKMKTYDATRLSNEQLIKLADLQETKNLSDREIAEQQLAASRVLANAADKSGALRVVLGQATGGVQDVLEFQKSYGETLMQGMDEIFSEENVTRYGETLTDAIAKGFSDDTVNEKFKSAVGAMFQGVMDFTDYAEGDTKKRLEDDNVLKYLNVADSLVDGGEKLMQNMSTIFEGMTSNISVLGLDLSAATQTVSSAVTNLKNNLMAVGDELLGDLLFQELTATASAPVIPSLPSANAASSGGGGGGGSSSSSGGVTTAGVVTVGGDIRIQLNGTNLNAQQTNQIIDALLTNTEFVEKLAALMNGRPTY